MTDQNNQRDEAEENRKVTAQMKRAWSAFEPVIPNTPPSSMRDSVLLRQGFMNGWLAAVASLPAATEQEPFYCLSCSDTDSSVSLNPCFRTDCAGSPNYRAPSDQEKLIAAFEELEKIAEQVGEGADPFAAWEAIDAMVRQRDAYAKQLAIYRDAIQNVVRCTSGSHAVAIAHEANARARQTGEPEKDN